jgi:hypothetical protein
MNANHTKTVANGIQTGGNLAALTLDRTQLMTRSTNPPMNAPIHASEISVLFKSLTPIPSPVTLDVLPIRFSSGTAQSPSCNNERDAVCELSENSPPIMRSGYEDAPLQSAIDALYQLTGAQRSRDLSALRSLSMKLLMLRNAPRSRSRTVESVYPPR